MNYSIGKASTTDARALSHVAMSSKAYWGYSSEFMSAASSELEVSEARLSDAHFIYQRLLVDRTLAGFYALALSPDVTDLPQQHNGQPQVLNNLIADHQNTIAELEGLFITPEHINQGFGQILFKHACDVLRSESKRILLIQSDPNALSFYLKQGCEVIGSKESGSIAGRQLPLLSLNLQ